MTSFPKRHPKQAMPKVGRLQGVALNGNLLGELDALRTTAAALEPLTSEQRTHVLACVCKLLAVEISELIA